MADVKEITSFTPTGPEQAMISVDPVGNVYEGGVNDANYGALQGRSKRLSRIDTKSSSLFAGKNHAKPFGNWTETNKLGETTHEVDMEASRALQASIDALNDRYTRAMEHEVGGTLLGSIRTSDVPLIQNILLYGAIAAPAMARRSRTIT